MNLITILFLLLGHWVGDFLFQSTWMGSEKFRNNRALLTHTTIYGLTMTAFAVCLLNLTMRDVFIFGIITFVAHTIQDYITSKMTHARFQKLQYNGWNGAFTVIGFDQWLHYLQILVTYNLLSNGCI